MLNGSVVVDPTPCRGPECTYYSVETEEGSLAPGSSGSGLIHYGRRDKGALIS